MAVTGNIGDAEVRLENAAEEATMQKILEALGGINDASNNGNTGLGSIIKKTGPLGIALGAVTGGFSLLGKAITGTVKVFGTIVKAGNAVIGFSAGLTQSQMEITDFTQKLADSKLNILGFGDTINAVTKLLYANYTTFQQLSTSGIAFGGRLEQMQEFSASVGISLDQLSGNLASNSEALARLGTGTRGATLAIDLAERAFLQNEAVLQRFGLSYAEQNENFLKFFAQNSLALQRGTMSQSQLINMSDDYAKGLRRLSEITGIQADQLEEGVEKASMNTAFDNFISQFDGETQNRLRSVINTMQAGFGDAGRESAMAMMMGVNPVTEGAQQLTSLMPGFGSMLSGLTNNARNFNGSLEDFNNSMYGQMNQFANANRGFADANSRYFGTLALMGDPYGQAGSELVRFVNIFGGSMEDMSSRLGQESPVQEAFNTFNRAIRDVRDSLAELFTKVFQSGAFTDAMYWLSGSGSRSTGFPYIADNLGYFIDVLVGKTKADENSALGKFKAGLDSVGNFLSTYNPFTEEGRERIANAFTNLIDRMYAIFVDSFLVRNILGIDQTDYVRDIIAQATDDQGNVDLSGLTTRQLKMIAEEAANPAGANYSAIQRQALADSGVFEGQFNPNNRSSQRDMVDQLRAFYRQAGDAANDPSSVSMAQMENFARFISERYPQRNLGTLGALGQVVEPKDTLAKIHAGERVLNRQETAQYNALQTATPSSSGTNNSLVQKLLDETKENRVQLVNALNTLHADMRELQRRQSETVSAIENYA